MDRETDIRDGGEAVPLRVDGPDTAEGSTTASEQHLVAPEQRAEGGKSNESFSVFGPVAPQNCALLALNQ